MCYFYWLEIRWRRPLDVALDQYCFIPLYRCKDPNHPVVSHTFRPDEESDSTEWETDTDASDDEEVDGEQASST